MIKININLGERSYPIYITTDYGSICKALSSVRINGKIAVITDANVDKFQSQECIDELKASGYEIYKYVFEAGESSKNLETIKQIYKFLIESKLDRNSTLIALGGGVTGDIAGFAAATFLRGIKFVQVPTSLLAQADSSIGGKVGVDFEGSKNIIGAFHQPSLVYINVNSLRTLPERELKSGLAEVIKHGLIKDADFFDYIDYNAKRIFNFNNDILQYLARVNCSIKGEVVEQDEKESGLRAILNFGHTMGHAIESVSNFRLLHGECVSLGMVGAYKMAQYLGMVDGETVAKVTGALEKIGLPVRTSGLDVEQVYAQMFYDKKIKKDKLVFVLPKAIGDVIRLSIDDRELVIKALGDILV